ncbi:hypothetical protein ACFQ3S_03230 [Mucilaginibacter terrae]|uniref:hypothetical protein n=1 Tax=Mucilaginibacter terrae TaxID=1955052 RepID=UPI0036448136
MDNPSHQPDQYCIVIVSPRIFSSKVDLAVDFGRDTNAANPLLQNEIETIKEIGSLVDALNYMAKKGWQMVNGYSVSNSQTALNEQHYLMRKAGR